MREQDILREWTERFDGPPPKDLEGQFDFFQMGVDLGYADVADAIPGPLEQDTLEGLTEEQYQRWADGSRARPRELRIDPDQAEAIRRAFPPME